MRPEAEYWASTLYRLDMPFDAVDPAEAVLDERGEISPPASPAYVLDAEVHGVHYDRLEAVRDYSWVIADGPGITHLYSAEDGLVRTRVEAWVSIAGFDRAP